MKYFGTRWISYELRRHILLEYRKMPWWYRKAFKAATAKAVETLYNEPTSYHGEGLSSLLKDIK